MSKKFTKPLTRLYFCFLLPISILSTGYLYFYPFFLGCRFPEVRGEVGGGGGGGTVVENGTKIITKTVPVSAPFRLLALADPQIEGDGSLTRYFRDGGWAEKRQEERRRRRKGRKKNIGDGMDMDTDSVVEETPPVWWEPHLSLLENYLEYLISYLRYARKSIDIWGNDLYLSHIYHTLHRYTNPTHTVVLGDLLSSQWVTNSEFEKRGRRFWDVIFSSGEKVTREDILRNEELDKTTSSNGIPWSKKIINVAGNHDIGYAGDMIRPRIDRFEETFGPVNYMFSFRPPLSPSPNGNNDNNNSNNNTEPINLRIIVLNSLALDTPIFDESIARDTYDLLHESVNAKSSSSRQATILLTHLPLYKPAGICTDGPYITYFPEHNGAGVKEQNHLTEMSSRTLFNLVFGIPFSSEEDSAFGKDKGIILTGHDHEGCDVWHYWTNRDRGENVDGEWEVKRFSDDNNNINNGNGNMEEGEEKHRKMENEIPFVSQGIREITVRSMMGDFDGNAGLLSAWFDEGRETWVFEYQSCKLGRQHLWWAVHVVDLIALVAGILVLGARIGDSVRVCSGSENCESEKSEIEQEKKEGKDKEFEGDDERMKKRD